MGAAPFDPSTRGGETTRPSELSALSSSSAASAFGPLEPGPRPAAAASPFDVCHVGVALRAVLLVQGITALGALYAGHDVASWTLAFARGSMVSLWAALMWLAASCVFKRRLAAAPLALQWGAALLLGALSTAASLGLVAFAGLGDDPSLLAHGGWLAPVASGAAVGATLFGWLRLRAGAREPAEAKARLAELQSRIRPHFLFNALNTALTLVRVDPARAEAVLEDLAELFRVALSEAGEAVSLADEVALARRYLEIEQVRFGDRLNVHWDVDARTHAARVPPLLLQPLVENAVRHGVEPAREGGTIKVRTRARRGLAVIDIVNTLGPAPSVPGHGMALANVRERLRLMHDVAAQFEVRRGRDSFRVQVVVPLA